MGTYVGYIRVSTPKQGETGVSLQAQREAIQSYGQRHNLSITAWFEEKESASKTGRVLFGQVMKLLNVRFRCHLHRFSFRFGRRFCLLQSDSEQHSWPGSPDVR